MQRYLAYQGTKFLSRFDANSFVELTKLMDTHDIGRDRKGGVAGALGDMTQPALIVSIDSDVLYPPYEQVRAPTTRQGWSARALPSLPSRPHLSSPADGVAPAAAEQPVRVDS